MRASRAAGLLSACVLAFALCQAARAGTVVAGTDYFQTGAGTADTFPGIGLIHFKGVPISPSLGVTDTIVERLNDVQLDGTTRLLMTALSLESVAPVMVGGSFFDVFVTLDPNNVSTGDMLIMGTTAGGTFNSTLNVFFDAHFQPTSPTNGQPFDIFNMLTLTTTGGTWSPTPPHGALLVTRPYPNLSANNHTGLTTDQVDFWPGPQHTGPHQVDPTMPEPATFGPLALVLGLGAWKFRPRRTSGQ